MYARLALILFGGLASAGIVSCGHRFVPVDHGSCVMSSAEKIPGQPFVNAVFLCQGQFVRMILPMGEKK